MGVGGGGGGGGGGAEMGSVTSVISNGKCTYIHMQYVVT